MVHLQKKICKMATIYPLIFTTQSGRLQFSNNVSQNSRFNWNIDKNCSKSINICNICILDEEFMFLKIDSVFWLKGWYKNCQFDCIVVGCSIQPMSKSTHLLHHHSLTSIILSNSTVFEFITTRPFRSKFIFPLKTLLWCFRIYRCFYFSSQTIAPL